jgi:hypothetical protein
MSILADLATDSAIADEKDTVGSGGILESGCYLSTVTLAYVTQADSGAKGLVLQFKTDEGRDIRQTLWMSSGKAKGGKNYYEDKSGQKQYLPGFVNANALALLTVGKEISQLDTETKVVSVWNKAAKAEVPTKVEVPVDLMGKEVVVGLIKQTVDKTAKNDSTGTYDPTGETRDENEIDKFFRAADRMTTAEIRAEAQEASFVKTWEDKWTGKTRNKSKGVTGTAGVPRAAVAAQAATKKPATSLFA